MDLWVHSHMYSHVYIEIYAGFCNVYIGIIELNPCHKKCLYSHPGSKGAIRITIITEVSRKSQRSPNFHDFKRDLGPNYFFLKHIESKRFLENSVASRKCSPYITSWLTWKPENITVE